FCFRNELGESLMRTIKRSASTGSYLSPRNTAVAAQRKATKALSTEWVVMTMVRHQPDADEPRDYGSPILDEPLEDRVAAEATGCIDCLERTNACDNCKRSDPDSDEETMN
ncbi:MAG: hypothetical protein Q8P17_01275, partial [bacterium]|nr:hypothetical protein [bacterium]